MTTNPVSIAGLGIDKQAQILLMPAAARRHLSVLPDEIWTLVSIDFYKDPVAAVFHVLVE